MSRTERAAESLGAALSANPPTSPDTVGTNISRQLLPVFGVASFAPTSESNPSSGSTDGTGVNVPGCWRGAAPGTRQREEAGAINPDCSCALAQ